MTTCERRQLIWQLWLLGSKHQGVSALNLKQCSGLVSLLITFVYLCAKWPLGTINSFSTFRVELWAGAFASTHAPGHRSYREVARCLFKVQSIGSSWVVVEYWSLLIWWTTTWLVANGSQKGLKLPPSQHPARSGSLGASSVWCAGNCKRCEDPRGLSHAKTSFFHSVGTMTKPSYPWL